MTQKSSQASSVRSKSSKPTTIKPVATTATKKGESNLDTRDTSILGLKVKVTDVTETNSDGTVKVVTKKGSINNIHNIYAIANFEDVRNMDNQRIMTGTALANWEVRNTVIDNGFLKLTDRLVLAYESDKKKLLVYLVDEDGNVLIRDGQEMTATFEETTNQRKVMYLGHSVVESENEDYTYIHENDSNLVIDYSGSNINLNISNHYTQTEHYKNDMDNHDNDFIDEDQTYADEGMLFAIPTKISTISNYIDQQTGQAIIPSIVVQGQSGSRVSARSKSISSYQLIGYLKKGQLVEVGKSIPDNYITKSGQVENSLPDDFDTQFLYDYYVRKYLAVGDSYMVALSDNPASDDYHVRMQIKRINHLGDIQVTVYENSDQLFSKIIKHGATEKSDQLQWSIHNTLNTCDTNEITWVYRKNNNKPSAPVEVKYLDQNGRSILTSDKLFGVIGGNSSVEPKKIAGYSYVKSDSSLDITFGSQPQSISLIYKLDDTAQSSNILGLPVDIITKIKTNSNGTITSVLKSGQVGSVKNVYAIGSMHEIRDLDDNVIMDGTAIALSSIVGWIQSYFPPEFRLLLSYDPEAKMTQLTFVNEVGEIINDPDKKPLQFSFLSTEVGKEIIHKVALSPWSETDDLYVALHFGGSNVDINFGDYALKEDNKSYIDWNPGMLLSIPNQKNIIVKYVDADTGLELKGMEPDQLEVNMGSDYCTSAKKAPKGYELLGTVVNGNTIQAGNKVLDKDINIGDGNTSATFNPDLDYSYYADYYVHRYLKAGDSYTIRLQDYARKYWDFKVNDDRLKFVPIDVKVTRLNQAGDIQIMITDLVTEKVQVQNIKHGDIFVYDGENDFWQDNNLETPGSSLRTFHNLLSLEEATDISYVYRKIPATPATYSLTGISSKVYDGKVTDINSILSYYSVKLSAGGSYTLVSGDLEFADNKVQDAKTGYIVRLAQAGINHIKAVNTDYEYTAGPSTATYNITLANANLKLSGNTKIYDGKKIRYVPTVTITSDKLTTNPVTLDSEDYEIVDNDSTVGSYTIKLTSSGIQKIKSANPNFKFVNPEKVSSQYTITPASANFKLSGTDNKVYNGQTVNVNDVKSHYVVTLSNGDQYQLQDGDLSFNSPVNDVDNYTVELTQTGKAHVKAVDANYVFTDDGSDATYIVNKRTVTVSAQDNGKIFGTKDPSLSGMVEPFNEENNSGLVRGDILDYKIVRVSGENVGIYAINVNVGNNKNYNVKVVPANFTITPKPLVPAGPNEPGKPANPGNPSDNNPLSTSIVIKGATKVYDGDATTDSSTYTVIGPTSYKDFVVPVLTADDFDLSGINSQNVGNYVVKLSAAGIKKIQKANKNYSFTGEDIQNGLFVITPAPITITAPTVSKTYDGKLYGAITGTVTGQPAKGVKPKYSLTDISSDVNVGTYPITVTPTDNANGNYTITTVSGKLTITLPVVANGTVTVHYIGGGKTIHANTELTGKDGDSYNVDKLKIDGYTFKRSDKNLDGKFDGNMDVS